MKKIILLMAFALGCMVAKAQYIGSFYMDVKAGYVVDQQQVNGSFGAGKVFKSFKVGGKLNYYCLNQTFIKANTITAEPEFLYYLFRGNKFSFLGLASGVIGYQKAKGKTELIKLTRGEAFIYGYGVGFRPELLISPKMSLYAEYRYQMFFNALVKNNNGIGLGLVFYL